MCSCYWMTPVQPPSHLCHLPIDQQEPPPISTSPNNRDINPEYTPIPIALTAAMAPDSIAIEEIDETGVPLATYVCSPANSNGKRSRVDLIVCGLACRFFRKLSGTLPYYVQSVLQSLLPAEDESPAMIPHYFYYYFPSSQSMFIRPPWTLQSTASWGRAALTLSSSHRQGQLLQPPT